MGADRAEDFLGATLAHVDNIHALARRLARDPQDAEDLVQETWLRAYAAWDRSPADVPAWLATICLNVARSNYRTRRRRPEVLAPDAGADRPGTSDPAAEAVGRVEAGAVHQALWGLPEVQREAVALMDLCGFTAAQVARLTDSPRGTVLARVHRARRTLALNLLRSGVVEPPGVRPHPRAGEVSDGSSP